MSPAANDSIERFRRIIAALEPLTQLIRVLIAAAVTAHALGFL